METSNAEAKELKLQDVLDLSGKVLEFLKTAVPASYTPEQKHLINKKTLALLLFSGTTKEERAELFG